MKVEIKRLELMTNIEELRVVKEKLKNDVMDPMLNWRERIELYQSIQGINERIQILTNRLQENLASA